MNWMIMTMTVKTYRRTTTRANSSELCWQKGYVFTGRSDEFDESVEEIGNEFRRHLKENLEEAEPSPTKIEDFWQSPDNLPTVTDEGGMPILVVVKEGGLGTRTDEYGNKVREDAVVTGVILPSGRIRAQGFSGYWVFTKWMPLPKP